MKKKIVLALSTLALVSALPAAAATTITADGWLRQRGIMANLAKGHDQDPDTLVDSRLRLRFGFSPSEYIKVVYFGEVDYQWGDTSYATARNQGGALGGDTVNLETKNLYAEVKFANTPLTMTAGLQGLGDNYDGSFIGMDGTALKFNLKTGMAETTIYWSKFYEGLNRYDPATNKTKLDGDDGSNAGIGSSRAEDDADLYAADIQLTPLPGLLVGANLHYFRNQGSSAPANMNEWGGPSSGAKALIWTDGTPLATGEFMSVEDNSQYYIGLNASYTLPFLTVTGWAMYDYGTIKVDKWKTTSATTATKQDESTVDVRGLGASAKVQSATFAGFSGGVRGLYYSAAGTDPGKLNTMVVPWGPGEPLPFAGDGLMIFLGDALVCTYGAPPAIAMQDAAWSGYGLLGGVLSGAYVPPPMKDLYVKASVGTFRARSSNVLGVDKKGKNLGTEIAGRVGYKFMGSVDVSLSAATAWFGDFYDETVNTTTGAATGYKKGNDDPERAYITYLTLNVPF